MRVVWAPLALERAQETVDFIARDRPRAAAFWLERLLDRVAKLDRLARRGRLVPEIGRPAYRELLHPPYRVIYRIDDDRVVILTLRHTRREWSSDDISSEE